MTSFMICAVPSPISSPHDVPQTLLMRQDPATIRSGRGSAGTDWMTSTAVFGAKPFAHRRLRGGRLSRVLERERPVAELATPRHRLGFGEREDHALVFSTACAECLALLDIGPAYVERGLRRSQHCRPISARLKSKPCMTWTKPAPSSPGVADGTMTSSKKIASCGRSPCCPDRCSAARRHARRIHRHQEGADAARAAVRRSGPGKQHHRVRLVGHADRRLSRLSM